MKPEISIPGHLEAAGRDFFAQVLTEYSIEDRHHIEILGRAAEQLDRAAAARTRIAAEGLLVLDRFGQSRPNPACLLERQAVCTFAKLIAALGLDLPAPPSPKR